jgi:hypothetical protein
VSEKDLGLKAQIRQLFWGMGFSTRVDVPMRAYVPPARSRTSQGLEEYTDLDVLAVGMSPDFRVEVVVADCKTPPKRAIERMFWLRGLADFFGAEHAYLVRAGDVPAAVRQLAGRLNISVVAPGDLALLQRGHVSAADGLEPLFDPERIAAYRQALTTLDKRLAPMLEYRQFDYWVYDEHLNLQQAVAHLSQVRRALKPENPIHCALFADIGWLYSLSLARAVQHIRRAHVADIDGALQEYLFGGQLGLREKQRVAQILHDVAGRKGKVGMSAVLPPYYGALLELLTRLVHEPQSLMPILRYAEWLTETTAAKRATSPTKVFGDRYNVVAGKLLTDICGFLVAAADLQPGFRDGVRQLLEGATASPRSEETTATSSAGDAPPDPASEPLRVVRSDDRPEGAQSRGAGAPDRSGPHKDSDRPAQERFPDA